jgi:uncharacterized membrane protein YkvA (DUF1232 family)
MPLKIELELSDEDLTFFSRVMDAVWKKNSKRHESELIIAARGLLKQARKAKAPEYVMKRLEDIGVLLDILDDQEWGLEAGERRRITAAISYFAAPKDMISDKVPGIGYLDDAVVAGLVIKELKHDIAGYREFCAFRDGESKLSSKKVDRETWLATKRKQLFDRIRKRRDGMFSRRSGEGLTHPILRFKY